MIKHIIYLLLGCVLVGCETPFFSSPKKFETPFEQKDGLKNSTYEEIIDYYKELSKEFTSISFKNYWANRQWYATAFGDIQCRWRIQPQ